MTETLRTDPILRQFIFENCEATSVPFQKSATIRFLAVSGVLLREPCERDVVDSVLRIADVCSEVVTINDFWGLELLLMSPTTPHAKRAVRIIIPAGKLKALRPADIPMKTMEFSEEKVGAIWYRREVRGTNKTKTRKRNGG